MPIRNPSGNVSKIVGYVTVEFRGDIGTGDRIGELLMGS